MSTQSKPLPVETINNVVVNAIPNFAGLEKNTKPHLGHKILNNCFSNVALIAQKNSGKTSAVFEMIKQCANENTKGVIFFVSTLYNDDSYTNIITYLEKKKIPVVEYTSIFSESDGHDQLLEIVTDLKNDAMKRKADEKKKRLADMKGGCDCDGKPKYIFDHMEGLGEKPKKESKYIVPEYIFVIDDLSEEVKSKSLTVLLKKNRHFKCMTIISTQSNIDLSQSQKKQLNVWLIWKAEDKSKMKTVYNNADIGGIMPFSYFMWMYTQATEPK